METITFHVGQLLRKAMTDKGLSVKQLAEKMGVSSNTIHAAFRSQFLTKKVVERICAGLDLTPESVLNVGTADKSTNQKQYKDTEQTKLIDQSKYIAELENQIAEQSTFIKILLSRVRKTKPKRVTE